MSYEDALRLSLTCLAAAYDRALTGIEDADVPVIYLDQPSAAPPRPSLDAAVRVAIAAFVVGAAVGVGFAHLTWRIFP